MNWRLLTEAEKRGNKRLRIARRKMRETHLRDEAMIMRLGQMLPSGDLMEDVLSPFEAFSMLYRPLQKGRAMEPLWKSAQIDPYATLDLLHSFTSSFPQAC